jgi:hypothetical protein
MKIRLTLILILACFIITTACRKQASRPSSNNASPTPESAAGGGAAQAGQTFYFRGNISGNLSIEMMLLRDGERLSGSYFYPKVGKNISLTGSVDKDGNVSLTESDESGQPTGVFKGKWKPQAESPDSSLNDIEGKWSRPDGTKETDFLVSQQPFQFGTTVRVTPKVVRETNKQQQYTVEAEYPQIEGDSRFEGFNREARTSLLKDVAAFKSAEQIRESDEPLDLPAETRNSSMNASYDFRYATDDLISVEFAQGTYSRGAAHGNLLTQVLNYDVRNGKKLALGDLFLPKSKYLATISSYCMKELRERAKNEDSMVFADSIENGAGPHMDNYRAVAITKNGLWVTFDPYQVAAYAAGPQHVLIPYSALKEIINPDGPIGMFAR